MHHRERSWNGTHYHTYYHPLHYDYYELTFVACFPITALLLLTNHFHIHSFPCFQATHSLSFSCTPLGAYGQSPLLLSFFCLPKNLNIRLLWCLIQGPLLSLCSLPPVKENFIQSIALIPTYIFSPDFTPEHHFYVQLPTPQLNLPSSQTSHFQD